MKRGKLSGPIEGYGKLLAPPCSFRRPSPLKDPATRVWVM